MEIETSEKLFNFFKKSHETPVEKKSYKEKFENFLCIMGFLGMISMMVGMIYFATSLENKAKEKSKQITLEAINTISSMVSNEHLTSSFQKVPIDYIENETLTLQVKKVDKTITLVVGDILEYRTNIKTLVDKIQEKNMKVVEITDVLNPESLKKEKKITIEY